jgi:hypothetical protein
MRYRLADLLRRTADRLDPPPASNPASTPWSWTVTTGTVTAPGTTPPVLPYYYGGNTWHG